MTFHVDNKTVVRGPRRLDQGGPRGGSRQARRAPRRSAEDRTGGRGHLQRHGRRRSTRPRSRRSEGRQRQQPAAVDDVDRRREIDRRATRSPSPAAAAAAPSFEQTLQDRRRHTKVLAKGAGTAVAAKGGKAPFAELVASGDHVSVSYHKLGRRAARVRRPRDDEGAVASGGRVGREVRRARSHRPPDGGGQPSRTQPVRPVPARPALPA